MKRPDDWKSYEDFAAGIATNRLPQTDALLGLTWVIAPGQGKWTFHFESKHRLQWHSTAVGGVQQGIDSYEAIEVAANTYFLDITFANRPRDALTLIVNTRTHHVLSIDCHVQDASEAGANPQVRQQFEVGHLQGGSLAAVPAPHPTRDLIGMRTWQTYSPEHTYEHTYLNSERYCWQCLIGVQRGQGDVDLASYYKFADNQYIFTFREFLIPVASVFFFNFDSLRSTGKFLGLTSQGTVENNPAGALIRHASKAVYALNEQPI